MNGQGTWTSSRGHAAINGNAQDTCAADASHSSLALAGSCSSLLASQETRLLQLPAAARGLRDALTAHMCHANPALHALAGCRQGCLSRAHAARDERRWPSCVCTAAGTVSAAASPALARSARCAAGQPAMQRVRRQIWCWWWTGAASPRREPTWAWCPRASTSTPLRARLHQSSLASQARPRRSSCALQCASSMQEGPGRAGNGIPAAHLAALASCSSAAAQPGCGAGPACCSTVTWQGMRTAQRRCAHQLLFACAAAAQPWPPHAAERGTRPLQGTLGRTHAHTNAAHCLAGAASQVMTMAPHHRKLPRQACRPRRLTRRRPPCWPGAAVRAVRSGSSAMSLHHMQRDSCGGAKRGRPAAWAGTIYAACVPVCAACVQTCEGCCCQPVAGDTVDMRADGEAGKGSSAGVLSREEERSEGRVNLRLYTVYLAAWGAWLWLPLAIGVLGLADRGVQLGQAWYVAPQLPRSFRACPCACV